MAVDGAPSHDLAKLRADGLFQQLLFRAACDGYDRVPVAHGGDTVRRFSQAVAYLRGEVAKLPNRGIFLEDQFSVLIREYLQRVTVTDDIDMVDLVRMLFRALDYGDG